MQSLCVITNLHICHKHDCILYQCNRKASKDINFESPIAGWRWFCFYCLLYICMYKFYPYIIISVVGIHAIITLSLQYYYFYYNKSDSCLKLFRFLMPDENVYPITRFHISDSCPVIKKFTSCCQYSMQITTSWFQRQ